MPRVPILNEPNAPITPMPAPAAPAPSAASFGSRAGAEIEGAGEVVGRLAERGWMMAVRQQTTEAETSFLKSAIQARTQYVSLLGKKAVDAYPNAVDGLYKSMQDIEQAIPSQQGRVMFRENAERNLRIEQSVIETHFASERTRYRLETYKDRIAAGTADLSTLALLGKDPLTTKAVLDQAQTRISTMEDRVRQEAADRGIDPADTDAFVAKEMRTPLTGFIDALAHVKHPALAEATKRWGGMLQKGPSSSVYKVMNEMEVAQRAGEIVAKLPHIDADRKEDEHGYIPVEALNSQLKALMDSDNPNKLAIADEVTKEFKRDHERFDAAGAQLENMVVRQGQGRGPGGAWDVPKGKDWEDLQRLYPERAAKLTKKSTVHDTGDLKRRIGEARGFALETFERMDPEMQKQQKYEQVASLVRTYEPRATGEDIDRVWKRVQDIQGGKGDRTEQRMTEIVKKGLKGAFGRDDAQIARYSGMARDFAEDMHTDKKEMSEDEIVSAIAKEAPNWVGGLFTKPNPYQKRHVVPPRGTTSAAPPAAGPTWTFNPDGSLTPPEGK